MSAIAPYEDYILGRWEQGCRNATQIWREISEQGYPGAYKNVVRITRYLKEQERLAKPLPDRQSGILASHAAGILVKRPQNRSEEETRTLERLKTVHRTTERCCTLFEHFAGMLRDNEQKSEEQMRERLEGWIREAKGSGVGELRAFAVKLFQDMEAVVGAMTLPYSQGQTEGRINKLKLVKRSLCTVEASSTSYVSAPSRRRVEIQETLLRRPALVSSDLRKNRANGSMSVPI